MSYKGKTLNEVAQTPLGVMAAFHVYQLKDKNDITGKFVDSSYGLSPIINKHPELKDAVVEQESTYMGEIVLRVYKEE